MNLWSYKITYDTGFAPNPFGGLLTLATCRPDLRRSRCIGDWIAGFTSGKLNGDAVGSERLIFLMRVKEKIAIADYHRDPRFAKKIPVPKAQRQVDRCGDNIYRPLCDNAVLPRHFEQLCNENHYDGAKGCNSPEFPGLDGFRTKDVKGKNVLIASQFVYFGRDAIEIPASIRPNVPRYKEVCMTDEKSAQSFIGYVLQKAGSKRVVNAPHSWPADDNSWRDG